MEYFCRAGTKTKWYNSKDSDVDDVAWHAGNAGATTREVGQKQPNEWGLYDLHGNVSEWTSTLESGKYIAKGGYGLQSQNLPVLHRKTFFSKKKVIQSV